MWLSCMLFLMVCIVFHHAGSRTVATCQLYVAPAPASESDDNCSTHALGSPTDRMKNICPLPIRRHIRCLQVPQMLEALAKLVNAEMLKIAYTEYQLDEFAEALDHALDAGKNTKILLRMPGFALPEQ